MDSLTLNAYVLFNGDLVLESTNERLPIKATRNQMERSYSASNPAVSVTRSGAWWSKNAPRAWAAYGNKAAGQ